MVRILRILKKKIKKKFNSKILYKKNFGIFRLGGKFIKSKNKNFEIKMLEIYRKWFLKNYFKDVDNIYEFGCGSGNNVFSASAVPKKKIVGLDFVISAILLINIAGKGKKFKRISI